MKICKEVCYAKIVVNNNGNIINDRFKLCVKVLFFINERRNTMKKMVVTMSFVFVGLMFSRAQAGLIYSHSFDDLTDITVSGCGTVAVSSEQSVESGHSLKFSGDETDNAPIASLTPTINGGLNTDPTITYVVRYYVTNDGNQTYDHANTRPEDTSGNQPIATSRGYKDPNTMNYARHITTGWDWSASSSVEWPTDGWFTIAVECDTDNDQYRFYAAAGTEVTTSDVVSDWQNTIDTGPITKWVFWSHYSGVGSDWYLDKFEIYSELGEGIVPEPATIGLLILGGLVLYRRKK